MKTSLIPRVLLVGLIAALIPAVAWGRGADDTGIVTLCSASGARTATGVFTFTLTTVASAGGTTTLTVPAGTCAAKLFYPTGVSVTVTQTASAGNAVTGISINASKGGPGTTTVISANNPKSRVCRHHDRNGGGDAHIRHQRADRSRTCLQGAECLRPHACCREGRGSQGELHRRRGPQGVLESLLPRPRLQPEPAARHRSRAARRGRPHRQPRSPLSARGRTSSSRSTSSRVVYAPTEIRSRSCSGRVAGISTR